MGRTMSIGRVMLGVCATAMLPACEQLKVIDEGSSACIPAEVQAAFERSCSGGTCHVGGGAGGGLQLDAGQSASVIGKTASTGTMPLVELGNTANSYLAQKIMENPTTTIVGVRMPDPYTGSDTQIEDINTILTWIAGGVFECEAADTGASTTADTGTVDTTGSEPAVQACGIEDVKAGAPNPIVSGTDPGQIPPDIGAILAGNCGCHYADVLDVMATDYPGPGPYQITTLAEFQGSNGAGTPWTEVTLNRVKPDAGVPMPSQPFCNVGDGEGMAPADRTTLVEWLTAGAPDCTTWTGCEGAMVQACGIEDIKPGSPNPIDAGAGAGQIPTDIGAILGNNCGCHYVDMPTADVTDYQGGQDISTIAGFQAAYNVDGDPLHELALMYVMTDFMPLQASCDIGGGEAMPPADRAVLVQWLTEGTPDGATWMP